jgi:TonB family protein
MTCPKMTSRFQEFLTDLNFFFADLLSLGNRQRSPDIKVRARRNILQDNARKVPLLLTVAFHLAILIISLAAPFITTPKSPRLPEVYTVSLYRLQEIAPPPPAARVDKTTAPPPAAKVVPPPKTVVPDPVPDNAVSLSPIRQKLAREMKEKEARKRRQELQDRKIAQVKLDLLSAQADKAAIQARNAAIQAENVLAEAKRDAAAKIADLYRKTAEYQAMDNVGATTEAQGTGPRNGEVDQQKLAALEEYRARLFAHISPHWQLPELQAWDENLRAVIVLQVKRDGSVINSYFEKRSDNLRFNQYAQKAIENARPLPPFPIDFHEKSEEIAVTFSPGGLL